MMKRYVPEGAYKRGGTAGMKTRPLQSVAAGDFFMEIPAEIWIAGRKRVSGSGRKIDAGSDMKQAEA